MHFNGVTNYINLFKDPLFWKALSNTLLIGIIAHIPILLGGLALAYILNSKLVKGENIFKTIYFMPMVTSSVAISIIFQTMFGNNYGVINWFLSLFGGKNINWLGGDGSLIKVAVIVMFAWKWVGWNMVIYLAGMQGISGDIYEAAKIDGASNTRVMFSIVIPLLKPIIVFTIVQSSIGMFNLFTEPFILTNSSWTGGVNNGGLTLMMYLLNKAPQGGNSYGYASACAYVITIMIVVISIFVNNFQKRKKQEGGNTVNENIINFTFSVSRYLNRDCQDSSDWKENLLIYCSGTDCTDHAGSVLYDVRYGNPHNQ